MEALGPCVLEGKFVSLEPLREEHAAGIFEATKSLDWEWFLGPLRTKEDVVRRIAEGVAAEERGEAYAFVARLNGGRIVGSTSYLAVVPKHRRAEIGSTWYSRDVWGTAVNPECKYLLLKHAFEDWGAVRVQLATDANNLHSQRAIAKLGAKFEGILRNHGIRPDGSVRDAKLYSIIDAEWPRVRSKLLERIQGTA
ncbi:MAG: GNAT family N-acetyltransferase [Nitrososphaerota archaeon]|nr:GNAT family N-acetyltransferase [Nitrososphaerota archaeon]